MFFKTFDAVPFFSYKRMLYKYLHKRPHQEVWFIVKSRSSPKILGSFCFLMFLGLFNPLLDIFQCGVGVA